MIQVWKVNVDAGRNSYDLPKGCEFLHAAMQDGRPRAWVRVDTCRPNHPVSLYLTGTGQTMPLDTGKHVSSFLTDGGDFVFHVFEIGE